MRRSVLVRCARWRATRCPPSRADRHLRCLAGEREAQRIAGVPVGRNGTVSDVADLITHRCREESGFITGATYDVNGGSHIH